MLMEYMDRLKTKTILYKILVFLRPSTWTVSLKLRSRVFSNIICTN